MRVLPLLLLPLACACSRPSPPTITPESATIVAADVQALRISVALTATNPNAIDLPVQDVTAHVVLGDKVDLGKVVLNDAVNLPAGKPTRIDLPLTLQWTDLPGLAQLAASPTPVPFTVDGDVELGGALLHVSVPFHIKGSMTHVEVMAALARSLPKVF